MDRERVADFKTIGFYGLPMPDSFWQKQLGHLKKQKECSMFYAASAYFLKYLDSMDIYYFNPLNPTEREVPGLPKKRMYYKTITGFIITSIILHIKVCQNLDNTVILNFAEESANIK